MNIGGGRRLVYNVRAFPLNLDSRFFMFAEEFLYVMLITSAHIFHGLFATFVESLLTCVLLQSVSWILAEFYFNRGL